MQRKHGMRRCGHGAYNHTKNVAAVMRLQSTWQCEQEQHVLARPLSALRPCQNLS